MSCYHYNILPKLLSGMTTCTTASDARLHPTNGSSHVTCPKINSHFVVITSMASSTGFNVPSSPSCRPRADRRLAVVMPTIKTGWFMVKGQTVEQQMVVGRTKASSSSGSREIVLFVVVLVTVPLILHSVVACRPW